VSGLFFNCKIHAIKHSLLQKVIGGLTMEEVKKKIGDDFGPGWTVSTSGKNVVFTGSLDAMSRAEAEAIVRVQGGRTSGTVSKTTDFVVVGRDPGSKYERARSFGVNTLTEREFLQSAKR